MPPRRGRRVRRGSTRRVVTVRKGEPWGEPATGPSERHVEGDDAGFARWLAARPDRPRVSWTPSPGADFPRAVGLGAPGASLDLPCDAVWVVTPAGFERPDDRGRRGVLVVNMAVIGTPPDRVGWRARRASVRVVVDGRAVHDGEATTVVVANGEFLRGADVVPRGHPGDGRIEVQVYDVARRERRLLRARIRTGEHLPHPRIRQASGRVVEVAIAGDGWPVELDGEPAIPAATLRAEVRPGAFVLVT